MYFYFFNQFHFYQPGLWFLKEISTSWSHIDRKLVTEMEEIFKNVSLFLK